MTQSTDLKVLSIPELKEREEIIASHVLAILETMDEAQREGLKDTPARVARMYMEEFFTHGQDPLEACLSAVFTEPTDSHEQVAVWDIPFHSICEHHLLPYHGVAHVGYVPRDQLLGLSKIARLVRAAGKGFSVQERVTTRVIDALERKLAPQGVIVVMEAVHTCMICRGAMAYGAKTSTSAVRGLYRDSAAARSEFFSLLGRR